MQYALCHGHICRCCQSLLSGDDGGCPEDCHRPQQGQTGHEVEDAAPAVIHGNKTNQRALQARAKAPETCQRMQHAVKEQNTGFASAGNVQDFISYD